jgi:predicted nucleic acid-binding Zn ribbon protein
MSQMHIGQVLQQLMKSAHWENRINAIRISDNWETIIGKTIAKYTESVVLQEGVLIIQTNVAPLKHELQANKEQIIHRVNEYLKAKVVKSVVIR